MDDTHRPASGTEADKQALDPWELGFLDGVLAAWGVESPNQADFRDALKMLMAQRAPRSVQQLHPGLRLATARPRQPPTSS